MMKKSVTKFAKIAGFAGAVIFIANLIGCGSVPSQTTYPKDVLTENRATVKQPKVKEEPKDPPDVVFVKGLQTELNKGDVKAALAMFENFPLNLEKNRDMTFLHASLYISDGQYDAAKQQAQIILETNPDDLEALELCSIIARASGNKAEYKQLSAEILKVDPYNSAANIQQAEDFAVNKKYKQAYNSYKKALTNDPKNTDALFGCGQMAFYLNDIKTSQRNFEKILEIEPNNPQALAYMGKLAADGENYLRASKYVQEAIKNDPTNYDYYLDLGTYSRYQGKYDEAIQAWNKATTLDPTYFLAYAYLAGIYDEKNDYDNALKNYRKVIQTNPKYYYAYEEAAILEWHLGDWAGAAKDFNTALEASGKKDWSYALMIAACYMKMGKPLDAKNFLGNFMKKMDKFAYKTTNKNTIEMTNDYSAEYLMVKFYYDNYSKNAETTLKLKVSKETSTTKRGKLLFYLGLYAELTGIQEVAAEYYSQVQAMQAPLFFEYRIAAWGMGLNN